MDKVLIHFDQGSECTSIEWQSFLKQHNLEHIMSHRGSCHFNAVAESFFNLLKQERIGQSVYKAREDARRDIFDYIGMLSPVEFENQRNENKKVSTNLGAIQCLFSPESRFKY